MKLSSARIGKTTIKPVFFRSLLRRPGLPSKISWVIYYLFRLFKPPGNVIDTSSNCCRSGSWTGSGSTHYNERQRSVRSIFDRVLFSPTAGPINQKSIVCCGNPVWLTSSRLNGLTQSFLMRINAVFIGFLLCPTRDVPDFSLPIDPGSW